MNIKPFLCAAFAALLLGSCDNGVIAGPNTATITATITPWRNAYDSVLIDVRVGGFRGPLREVNADPLYDPDQSQIFIDDLPLGDWVFAAVYYKTNRDTQGNITGTSHRVAVAQGSVEAVYDSDCDCRYLEGDNVDLRLAD